jgi:hypothetical protein
VNPSSYAPGTVLVVLCPSEDADLTGVALRMSGWTIRDSIQVYVGGMTYVVWLVRAPMDPRVGGIVEHAVTYGTGGLHVDAVRIGTDVTGWGGGGSKMYEGGLSREGGAPRPVEGRWPPNVLVDSQAAAQLDAMSPGASTFFPRVETIREALEWLQRLIDSPSIGTS